MTEPNPAFDAAADRVAENGHTACACHALYEEVCQQAARQLERIRHMDAGKLADEALEFVRKHPGASVAIAAVAGFYVGRLGRK